LSDRIGQKPTLLGTLVIPRLRAAHLRQHLVHRHLEARDRRCDLRASAAGIFRDLPFVLRNQPSFIPFETLPKAASTCS
jgi:hypothetical protein